jgi:hypothetical protein
MLVAHGTSQPVTLLLEIGRWNYCDLEQISHPQRDIHFFEPDLLPEDRTTELPGLGGLRSIGTAKTGRLFSDVKWEKLGPLPNVIDIFSDSSV